MADATTSNYGWSKPTNGADSGSWGSTVNGTIDAIDNQVKSNDNATAKNGGGPFQAGASAHNVQIGPDQAGAALRAAVDGNDFGYLLRSTSGFGKNSGGLVTISPSSPSGTPNDGDVWLQYS